MLNINLPIHPMLVHFPIALFVSALMANVFGMISKCESVKRTAWHLYSMAVFFTVFAVSSGLWEENRLHLRHPVASLHKNFALATLGVSLVMFAVLYFMRKKASRKFQPIFLITLTIITALIIATAYNGGRLVYEYSVGISQ